MTEEGLRFHLWDYKCRMIETADRRLAKGRAQTSARSAPGRGRDFQQFLMSWMRFKFDLQARVTM